MARYGRWFAARVSGAAVATALLLAAAPCAAEDTPTFASAATASEPSPDCVLPRSRETFALAAGVQLGTLLPVGLGAMLSIPGENNVRWQIDVVWEPSNYLQSYSVGGSYHPWEKVFFAGARLRFMQLHAPWSRGFRARTDNQFALGPELGVRFSLGARPRFLPFASLGVIFFPSGTLSLPPMFSIDIGTAVDLVSGRLR
jgi:hypothetical protein